MPGWYAVYGPDSAWEPYSGRTGQVVDESFGSLGLRTATLQTGASQTYEVTGTSAYVYYLTNGGDLGVSVDDAPGPGHVLAMVWSRLVALATSPASRFTSLRRSKIESRRSATTRESSPRRSRSPCATSGSRVVDAMWSTT